MSDAITIPRHVAIDEAKREAFCAMCGMGMTMPQDGFGPIPTSKMLASFAVLHATHSRHGKPEGLTKTGRISKRAARVLTGGGSDE